MSTNVWYIFLQCLIFKCSILLDSQLKGKQTNKQTHPQPCEVFTLECIPELVNVNSNTAAGCGVLLSSSSWCCHRINVSSFQPKTPWPSYCNLLVCMLGVWGGCYSACFLISPKLWIFLMEMVWLEAPAAGETWLPLSTGAHWGLQTPNDFRESFIISQLINNWVTLSNVYRQVVLLLPELLRT